MKVKSAFSPTLLLSVLLLFVLASGVHGQSAQKKEAFSFGKVDLDLLQQTNLLDQKLEKDGLVYADKALDAYLNRLGQAILASVPALERVQWRIRVLRDPLANAFALPNGSIYVNTGLLSLMENEGQLASVLAHEVTHVLNRHSYLQNRSIRKKMVAIHILQAAGSLAPVNSVVGATIYAVASSAQVILVATVFGYSRELEKEADLFAVTKLSDAGYDPREVVNAFKLLQKKTEVELVKVYYNDHPKLEERIAYVNQTIQSTPSKSSSSESSAPREETYLPSIEQVARHNVQLDIDSGRLRTAISAAQRLVDFNPKSSGNLLSLAEAYRALGPRTPEVTAEELTSKGKKTAVRLKQTKTLEEEEQILLATAAGQTAWKTNQGKAEELYRRALEADPANAKAHRGLGFLFEKAEKNQQAVEEYRKYLELQPDAPDGVRITRRLEALTKTLKIPEPKAVRP